MRIIILAGLFLWRVGALSTSTTAKKKQQVSREEEEVRPDSSDASSPSEDDGVSFAPEFCAMKNNMMKFKRKSTKLKGAGATVETLKKQLRRPPSIWERPHVMQSDLKPGMFFETTDYSKNRYAAELDFPEYAASYWADPRIHGFGNFGHWGAFHALVAPFVTLALDVFAYGGTDVRTKAWHCITEARAEPVLKAADFGTGTGTTARSMVDFFNCDVTALDTSSEMLRAAYDLTLAEHDTLNGIDFRIANVEATGLPSDQFDLVTVFFLLHEVPSRGRVAILKEALRIAKSGGTVAVADIHPAFEPSSTMSSGEPYVRGYLDFFEAELVAFRDRNDILNYDRAELYPDRLVLWTIHKP